MLLWLEADRNRVPLGSFRFNSDETRTIKIGSLKSAHIRLPGLPRVQAVIRVKAGQASVIDVGGGMCVNGAPTHRAVVTDGDSVSFGPVTLRARIEDREAEPEEVPPPPAAIVEPSDQKPDPDRFKVTGDFPYLAGGARIRGRWRKKERPVVPGVMPPERPVSSEAHALELRLYWGETVLDLLHYERPRAVTIGEAKNADVFLSSDGLPTEAFPLVRTHAGHYVLCFTSEMTGEVETGGRVLTLDEWRRAGARPDPALPDTWLLPLSIDARAVVFWAGMTFALRFVPPPRGIRSSLIRQMDLPYLNTVMLSVLFHLVVGVGLAVYPSMAEELADPTDEALVFVLDAPPHRFVPPPDVQPPPRPAKKKLENAEVKLERRAKRQRREGRSTRAPERFRDFFASLGGSQRRVLVGDPVLTREIANVIRSARPVPVETLGFGLRDGVARETPAISLRTIGEIDTRPTVELELPLRPKKDRPPPEMISIGTPETSPGLSREQIAKVVNNNRLQLRFCYERELFRHDDLDGRILIHWVIGPDGRVIAADVTESSVGSDAMERCLIERVKAWQFPEPAGGGVVEVNYPIQFCRI